MEVRKYSILDGGNMIDIYYAMMSKEKDINDQTSVVGPFFKRKETLKIYLKDWVPDIERFKPVKITIEDIIIKE